MLTQLILIIHTEDLIFLFVVNVYKMVCLYLRKKGFISKQYGNFSILSRRNRQEKFPFLCLHQNRGLVDLLVFIGR